MSEALRVDLGKRSYDIRISGRALAEAGRHIKPLLKTSRVFIISDETVARLYLHRLTNSLDEQGIRAHTVILPPGEGTKSYAQFERLLEQLIEQKIDRKCTLIALGGGVIGDITGFAASVLLRGIDFIQIPTTLLAQVDSSVGGKTGINSSHGKNLVGSFWQPQLVLADTSALSTLPKRELLAGYAEVVKYGLLGDADFFAWLDKNVDALLTQDMAALTYAIKKSCTAKAAIVALDETEQGARALLNLGHTFAHALEAETGYSDRLLHGEAVAIGMVLAFELSARLGLCPADEVLQVKAHIQRTGLPSSPLDIQKEWNVDALMEHFTRDKKAKDGTLTFVLARGIGNAFVAEDVERAALAEMLAEVVKIA